MLLGVPTMINLGHSYMTIEISLFLIDIHSWSKFWVNFLQSEFLESENITPLHLESIPDLEYGTTVYYCLSL